MSAITKELRAAAKCAPMWKAIFEAAADEIERLQGREGEIKAMGVRQAVSQVKMLSITESALIECAISLERGEL